MPQSRTFSRSKLFIATKWPKLIFAAGWALFWLAGAAGRSVPVAALLVGPGVMLAGIVLSRRNRFRQRDEPVRPAVARADGELVSQMETHRDSPHR